MDVRTRLAGPFGGLCFLLCLLLARPPRADSPPFSQHGVVSESRTAAQEAVRVLSQGGSAIDAAIVAALVSGVTAPTSSGIGGGGFALVWDAEEKTSFVIDFREVAPRAAVRDPLERRPLDRSEVGHLVGVPGEVRGLFELHQRGGRLPWSKLVGIAADRARKGYSVSRHLASMLAAYPERLQSIAGLGLYYPGGRPAPLGRRLNNPVLAKTLDKIAAEGPRGFYEGEVAADVVATARSHGSTMTLADLKRYSAKEREPIAVRYAGSDVYTMPPPSAGGIMLAQTLKMFPPQELEQLGHGTPAYQHLIAEGMRAAIADRARYLADPDVHPVPLKRLLDERRLEKRKGKLSVTRTHAIPRFGQTDRGTHALVTADRWGNAVSLTTTVNWLFGARIVAEKSGVVLNNELADFSARKHVQAFGMRDTPNHLRPLARPVSSMTPTIAVKEGVPVLALGGSGGTKIATNVTQTVLRSLVFDFSPERAVSEKRFHVPMHGATLRLEPGFGDDHVADLKWRGEVLGDPISGSSAVQLMRMEDGRVQGAADPRKHGSAVVW